MTEAKGQDTVNTLQSRLQVARGGINLREQPFQNHPKLRCKCAGCAPSLTVSGQLQRAPLKSRQENVIPALTRPVTVTCLWVWASLLQPPVKTAWHIILL